MAEPWFWPRFWKIPLRQWPAFWLHHPPTWIWKFLARVPERPRWVFGSWLSDLPGVCGLTVHAIGAAEYSESGILAGRCLKDGAPCWCTKYRSRDKWARHMEKLPQDPLSDVRITFSGEPS